MWVYLPRPRDVHHCYHVQQQWESPHAHRIGHLGHAQEDRKENTGRKTLKVHLKQPAACCLMRRHRSAISSLLIPCEQLASADQPCRKHMFVTIELQACSHRAAGGGTARHRATGRHSTHPSHPPPSPAPATAATQTR